jgi:queuosine precursor transporter
VSTPPLTPPSSVSHQPTAYVVTPSATYAVVMSVFCGLLLISNVAATKLITVFEPVPLIEGIYTDGGAFLFPLTYVLGDVLAEVYGLRNARRAIFVGFVMAALASATFLIVGAAPPGPGYENQAAFQAVLGFVPRIVVASLIGYTAGQLLNAYVLVRMKDRAQRNQTRPGRLWARLVGSTVVGEFADTALFCFIAFVGVFPTWTSLISFTIAGYVYKVAVEVFCLPVTYAVIRAIKRRESYAVPDSGWA